MFKLLISMLIVSFVAACGTVDAGGFKDFMNKIASSVKYKDVDYKHKAPAKQSWSKCQSFDVKLDGKKWKHSHKEYFCYRWCSKRRRTGDKNCKTWKVKKYHMVKDHDIMVSRGVWMVR